MDQALHAEQQFEASLQQRHLAVHLRLNFSSAAGTGWFAALSASNSVLYAPQITADSSLNPAAIIAAWAAA